MIARFSHCLVATLLITCLTGADWRQFRGNDTTGIAANADVPITWSDTENMAWKVDLPGRGLSSPIIIGNRIILTACSGYLQDRLHVLCFRSDTGAKLWERQFWATGRTMCHPKMSVASSTPASDGKRVFAQFSTNDLVCLDLDGNLQWLRGLTLDYPNASNSLGMASSPIVVGETLVVQVENDSESFAAGLNTSTGENRWKLDRPILANWTSPVLLPGRTRAEDTVLLQSGKGLTAVEPATGREVWRYGDGCGTIPSAVTADGVVYVPSKGITALRHDGMESTATVLWQSGRLGPGTASPIVLGDRVLTVNPAGVLNCADRATGDQKWQLRLQGPFSGTPAAANGYLYFVNENGLAQVVKPGTDSGEVVGTHDFGEVVLCSPSIADNALYVRSDSHLWKVARTTQQNAAAKSGPPSTRKQPVVDTYHGVAVTDDYRWLENWNDKEVQAWSDAQNAHARAFLDKLPGREAIHRRVTEILSAKTVVYAGLSYHAGKLFAIVRQPPKQQPFLVVMSSADAPETARTLVDPTVIDPKGGTTIDWYVPSADGSQVAVSLSQGGSEAGDVHFFETATGKRMHEVIPRVNSGTAGGDLAWMPDNTGVFYTRHPQPGERQPEDINFYQQVYFHKFGSPTTSDRYELGKDFPRVAGIEFETHAPTGTLLATVQNGDGGEFAHYLRSAAGQWKQLSKFEDQLIQVTFGPTGDLYLISRAGAPRGKVLRLPLSQPELNRAQTLIPEVEDTIVTTFYHNPPGLVPTESRLYVIYQLGGPSELRVFDLTGKPLPLPKQLSTGTVSGLTKLDGDDVLFSNMSFVDAPAVYRYWAKEAITEKTKLATPSPVNFVDVKVVREFAVSKDGTKVPVNILLPKGFKPDGSHRALLNGYGGYGISQTPVFTPSRHVLLQQGVVYAVANLRGGAEYGEPWHRQGALTHKQNVFDDFTAVMQHLIDKGYTSPSRLAIEGGSNGGLLMGAAFTQHPELMKAVVSHVGIYDMLRVELSPNGAFNIAEFGTVQDREQFLALHAYSPYHRVTDGTKYPAVLFLTGANDPRVDPMQSRKMTARLQVATGSGQPILLRTSSDSGHGAGTALNERIEQTVDVYSFLFDRLNLRYDPAK